MWNNEKVFYSTRRGMSLKKQYECSFEIKIYNNTTLTVMDGILKTSLVQWAQQCQKINYICRRSRSRLETMWCFFSNFTFVNSKKLGLKAIHLSEQNACFTKNINSIIFIENMSSELNYFERFVKSDNILYIDDKNVT